MARRIYVKSATGSKLNPPRVITFVFWYDVPTVMQASLANPDATSQVSNITQAELDAIKQGKLYEIVRAYRWSDPPTDPDIMVKIKDVYKSIRAEILGQSDPTIPVFVSGSSYDLTTELWSQ